MEAREARYNAALEEADARLEATIAKIKETAKEDARRRKLRLDIYEAITGEPFKPSTESQRDEFYQRLMAEEERGWGTEPDESEAESAPKHRYPPRQPDDLFRLSCAKMEALRSEDWKPTELNEEYLQRVRKEKLIEEEVDGE